MFNPSSSLKNRLLPVKMEIDTASYIRGILYRKPGILAHEKDIAKPATEFDHQMISTVLTDLKTLGNAFVANGVSSTEPKTYGRLVFSLSGTRHSLLYKVVPGINPANTNMLGRFISKTIPIFNEQHQPIMWQYDDTLKVTLYDNNNDERASISGILFMQNETLGIGNPYFNFVERPDVQRYRWFAANKKFMDLLLVELGNNQPAPIDSINADLHYADQIGYHILKEMPDSLKEE